ncbi:MAG: peptidoglycan-binding protein [Clostridia bacterium]|nr:peptidoglycan-binding protein [Clostridia bacterium]
MATPIIPESIRVHLGSPRSSAENVTVSFPDYIKNVASSEIYSTWPEEAIRANVLAQVSFALNRIYTEWYPSMGYDFDITNNTNFDQKFIKGRNVYENISRIVDDLFNDYIRKEGTVNPFFAQYCNGTTVTCDGLSQWGTVPLAEDGLSAFEILENYYGNDIELVVNAPVADNLPSYPGTPLAEGSLDENVRRMQLYLNRISANYPSIPKISVINGLFDENTENAVKAFQRIFNLDPDGIIGKATWYRIVYIYSAVTRLAELTGEGIGYENLPRRFEGDLSEGDSGGQVVTLQYFLNLISFFNSQIPGVDVDGIYGAGTKNSVAAFQRFANLPQTGAVDKITWDNLYGAYKGTVDYLEERQLIETVNTQPYPGVVLRRGDTGPSVLAFKTYLNYIASYFFGLPSLATTPVFDTRTQNAVRQFQQIFSLPATGQVNESTWNTIADVYRVLREGQQRLEGQYPGYEIS